MKCDGRIIAQSSYDVEWGTSAWVTYVGSSPLSGLALPDLTGSAFLTGVSLTTQTGSSAVVLIGANTINIAHTHAAGDHVHQIYNATASGVAASYYNSLGVATSFNASHGGSAAGLANAASFGGGGTNSQWPQSMYTGSTTTGSTASSLSSAQSIIPKALEVQFYMRIIP
jgi:hypothetical protein